MAHGGHGGGGHHGHHRHHGHHFMGLAFLSMLPGFRLLLLGFALIVMCGL